jgi:PAS domain S-box-containing protein
MLQAVGQMVALLLRSAWALRAAARERTEAIAAKERYHALFEHVPIGLYRTTPTGKMLDVNPAMVQILRFPDAQSLLGVDARTLWVNPDDRRHDSTKSSRDIRAEFRTGDGATVWVRLRSEVVKDGDEEYWEGVLEDITAQRRAEEAERRAEALRAVAQLANAAAHEINNPLAVIVGRLELLRRHLQPEQQARFDDVIAASKRITEIIAHMGRITRLETMPGSHVSPMLDLRGSGTLP